MYLRGNPDITDYQAVSVLAATKRTPAKAPFAKRAFDVLFVLMGLPAVLLVLAIAAIAIKLNSRGPILFVQHRYGLGRVPFRVFKLRR